MSQSASRPPSPGTKDTPYSISYQTTTTSQQQHQPPSAPQQDTSKALFANTSQPTSTDSVESSHALNPETVGSARFNSSLDLSLATNLASRLNALGTASSTWSTQSPALHPSVYSGYSHPGSITGTPESRSRVGSVGPASVQLFPNNMEGSAYESSWRNHYGQSSATNGYNLGTDRESYPYGLSQNNAYNRVPAGYSAYSSTAQPHHLMSMGASSATQSSHDVDIPREPYIPPSNTGNGSSTNAFQSRASVGGYPPNAYDMAVAAHQLQASQHAQQTHGYPGSHVSGALLHGYSSSPMTMPGLASGSHHVSPAASSYNLNGLMNHPSPYAAAAAAAGHPIAPRKTKYTRSRTGCLACRVKRVKCDETRPVCKRCIGAKRECVFPSLADLPKATIRALTAKKRKESGDTDLDDSVLGNLTGASNSGNVSATTSANASGDELESTRIRHQPVLPSYQSTGYNPYSATTGPYAMATQTYAPQAAAYSQMYGGDRALNLQAEWQNRLQAQDYHRSAQSSRTGTPSLAAVVAANNAANSPSGDGTSDEDRPDVKGESIESGVQNASADSSKMYLSQQRNDLLALQQQHPSYYTASTTLPRLSSPNCKP